MEILLLYSICYLFVFQGTMEIIRGYIIKQLKWRLLSSIKKFKFIP
jgi:hypothetical protein